MIDPIPRHVIAAVLLVAGIGGFPVTGAAADPSDGSAPDCQCRDPSGARRDLGTLECVTIGTNRHLVRCEMSTNTPYWRRVDDGGGCSPIS